LKPTRTLAALAAIAALTGLAACSTVAPNDEVGLYYMQGPSDGDEFGFCIDPSKAGDFEWNNEVIFLPTNLRTWVIANQDGADSKDTITVSAKPEEGQPSGVQVNVWTKTNFKLNTYCDKNGGVVRQFWETIGHRYNANTEDGWKKMLLAEFVPTQQKIIADVVRQYSADDLVANKNGIRTVAQTDVGKALAVEFNRITGGPFFCGPSFNRASSECPLLELSIINVEFSDPGIQQARNEKQKAIELGAAKVAAAEAEARALVAEAQGKADAAAKLDALYRSPGWLELQKKITEMNGLIEACKVAKECRLIVGADGNLIMA
jgi:hypothetical protein